MQVMWKYHGIIFFGMVLETSLGGFYDKMTGDITIWVWLKIVNIILYTSYTEMFTGKYDEGMF